jgi:hypothetical protein
VCEDAQGILAPSAVGTAYLIYVVARDIRDPAEAFAAEFEAASELLRESRPKPGWSPTSKAAQIVPARILYSLRSEYSYFNEYSL